MTTYMDIDPRFQKISCRQLKAIGIVTDAEQKAFLGGTYRNTDIVFARLTAAYTAAVANGHMPGNTGNGICGVISRCQETMHRLQNCQKERMPEFAVAIMVFVLDILHLLFLVVLPLSLNVESGCFQVR